MYSQVFFNCNVKESVDKNAEDIDIRDEVGDMLHVVLEFAVEHTVGNGM